MSKESKGRKPGVLSRCLRFAGRRKPLVFASMALAVLSAAASFVPYVAIYFMIKDAVGVYPNLAAVDVSAMTGYAGLAVAGIVVDVGCYLAALLCSHAAAFDTQYRTKLDIAAHLGRIPLGHVARLGTGRISKVMDESVGGIEQFIGHSIPDLAATVTAPVVLVALLFVFDWRFGIATLAAVAVACVVQFSGYADKRVMASMGRYQEVKEQMGNAAVEYVRGMRVVKAFGQTARSFKRLTDAIKDYTGLSLDVTLFFRNSMPGFTAVLNNAYLFVLPVGILLAPGAQDWPTFVLSLVFYLLFVHSISSVFAKILYVSEDGMLAQANIDRIDSVLGIEALSAPEVSRTPKDASVSLRDVTFSYGDGAGPALRDVSLDVPAGTVCAVVGPSGSGKSTLANLVARFWDVDSGQVLVGGRARDEPGRADGQPQPGVPGFPPVPREHRGQHPARPAGSDRRGGRRGSEGRPGRCVHKQAAQRLRHRDRLRGRPPVRRRAAADSHRALDHLGFAHRGAGRGDRVLRS